MCVCVSPAKSLGVVDSTAHQKNLRDTVILFTGQIKELTPGMSTPASDIIRSERYAQPGQQRAQQFLQFIQSCEHDGKNTAYDVRGCVCTRKYSAYPWCSTSESRGHTLIRAAPYFSSLYSLTQYHE